MSKLKPILFLLLASPLLAETFISHNTPVAAWLNPGTWVWMILAYGIPVLVIREIWKQKSLNFLFLLIFGVAYGIFNEGIIAHTLTQTSGSPVLAFIGYGTVGGVHLTWATFILIWHALVSVTLPILLTEFLFPSQAKELWLSKKWFTAFGIISILAYSFYFTIDTVEASIHPASIFIVYLIATWVLYMLAIFAGKKTLPTAIRQTNFKRFILWSAIIPNILFVLVYNAGSSHFPPAPIFILLGWGIFCWFINYIFSHGWSQNKLLTFLLAFSAVFSLMFALLAKNIFSIAAGFIYLIFGTIILKKLSKILE